MPTNSYDLFKVDEDAPETEIAFTLQPVVFWLPERIGAAQPELFVVISGKLSFDREEFRTNDRMWTRTFSTRAAYFRLKDNALTHVYGAHYDFTKDTVGHPVFHAQIHDLQELASEVASKYSLGQDGLSSCVHGVLKNVRLPCAQMDFFSLFLQVLADHLLTPESSADDILAFTELVAHSRFLKGAGFQFHRLGTEPAISCYRSSHWYLHTPENQPLAEVGAPPA